jgi:hypothetical protein
LINTDALYVCKEKFCKYSFEIPGSEGTERVAYGVEIMRN